MLFRKHRKTRPQLDESQLKLAWKLASLLLDYPTEKLIDDLPTMRELARALPDQVQAPLVQLMNDLGSMSLAELDELYVETFDYTRKCSMFLTYFTHGDTRKRGVALVQFKQAYRSAGLEITDDELPDHLCVVLDFGALGDWEIAWKLLNDHRASIEVLRLALADRESPWLAAVDAVRATLPPLQGDAESVIAKIIAEGPPDEEVGLPPFEPIGARS